MKTIKTWIQLRSVQEFYRSFEKGMNMKSESEALDVIMCTWNSCKPWFRKCLLSIKREVNVHCFLVIDRYSSDDTASVIRSVFPEAKIIYTNANLAVARKVGIKQVDTRYFAFIDDDVELCGGWFKKLFALITNRERIGAVQGFTRYFVDYLDKIQISELRFRKGNYREVTGRGLTHNTIILSRLVKDFKPPPIIHSWEDFLLTQHIIEKDYKWIEAYDVQIIHYMNAPCSLKENFFSGLVKEYNRAKWTGSGARLVRARTLPSIIFSFFATIYYGLLAMIFMLDPRTLIVNIVTALGLLMGFLSLRDITSIKLRQISLE